MTYEDRKMWKINRVNMSHIQWNNYFCSTASWCVINLLVSYLCTVTHLHTFPLHFLLLWNVCTVVQTACFNHYAAINRCVPALLQVCFAIQNVILLKFKNILKYIHTGYRKHMYWNIHSNMKIVKKGQKGEVLKQFRTIPYISKLQRTDMYKWIILI
jgi:hypothetical protein